MRKTATILAASLVIAIAVLSCRPPKNEQNPEAIASAACENVGVVTKSSKGTKGSPILVLEESHASRAGQIQHAITLVRLYEKNKLRHIALEGYLKERPEIKTDWFVKGAKGLDQEAKYGVAVRLLKEGEISSAEFMKLVFEDISLHPIETTDQYSVELDDNASRAPILYLVRIAQKSLRQEQVDKILQMQNEIEILKEENRQKKGKEMIDYIISTNSWTQDKVNLLQDKDAGRDMSAEQILKLIVEIENRAKDLSIDLKPDEEQAMARNLRFWRERIKASETMVGAASEVADKQDIPIVVMSIGAAHTEGVTAKLKAAGRPFAVVTPLSLKERNESGDLTEDILERKYQGLSVYSEGFTKTILNAFPSSAQKKPEPVLAKNWFRVKGEGYLFIKQIVDRVFDKTGAAGGGPPWGFSDNDLKGETVGIDPRQITVYYDDESKRRVVLFPVTIYADEPSRASIQFWVKATRDVAEVPIDERRSTESLLESMLRKALGEVQSEKELSKQAEDNAGRIQITSDTLAAFASTPEAVKKVALGS